jgi:hypothetical protein
MDLEIPREQALAMMNDWGKFQDFVEEQTKKERFAQSVAFIKEEQRLWKEEWKKTHPRKPRIAKEDKQKMLEDRACHFVDGRCYLHVEYREKNDYKKLGARWDGSKSQWYVESDCLIGGRHGDYDSQYCQHAHLKDAASENDK